jgi:hypothetical protein
LPRLGPLAWEAGGAVWVWDADELAEVFEGDVGAEVGVGAAGALAEERIGLGDFVGF